MMDATLGIDDAVEGAAGEIVAATPPFAVAVAVSFTPPPDVSKGSVDAKLSWC